MKSTEPNLANTGKYEGETIVTDEKTGGKKGAKLARFSLIPSEFLWALAEHYGRGARKYEDRNWEKGYKWSLSLDAHSRHLHLWLGGEDNDGETGTNHLIAAAWHLIALFIFQLRGLGTDDLRPEYKPEVTSGFAEETYLGPALPDVGQVKYARCLKCDRIFHTSRSISPMYAGQCIPDDDCPHCNDKFNR